MKFYKYGSSGSRVLVPDVFLPAIRNKQDDITLECHSFQMEIVIMKC